MLSYEEFVQDIMDEMGELKPDHVVERTTVDIEGHSMDALILRGDSEINARRIFPQAMYKDYVNGMPYYTILTCLTRMVCAVTPDMNINPFIYEDVKKRLFIRVSLADRCEELLDSIPHRIIEDLVITYHIFAGTDGRDEDLYAVIVNNEMMKEYGIDEEQLHEDAVANAAEMFPSQLTSMDSIPFDIYCLTNRRGNAGSSALFYPGEMKRLAKRFRNRKLTILPVSVEEVVIIPGSELDGRTISGLGRMLYETFRMDHEELSDGIYTYSPRTDTFERTGTALAIC